MRVAECTLQQAPVPPQALHAGMLRQRLMPGLNSHWQGRADYTILDTAFEFGLRFLASWQAWRESAHRPSRLHYIALVPRFYGRRLLEDVHAMWPEFAALASALREHWPCAVPGMHRLLLPDADLRFTLILGEKRQDLAQIDAWIDTFLPDDHFFKREAASVRRDLTWFARLAAAQAQIILPDDADPALLHAAGFVRHDAASLASFAPRWQVDAPAPFDRHAIVIGAGLAGAAVSHRLCARGWQVELIERHLAPAQEASGNLAGIVMPVLARDDNPLARFSRAAFLFALRQWRDMGGVGLAFDGALCGVVQLLADDEQDLLADYPAEFARAVEASEAYAHAPSTRAWFFKQGGWINPASLCRAMLDACGGSTQRRHGVVAARLEREGGKWQVFDDNDQPIAQAPYLVLANGIDGNRFAQTGALPLAPVRGQVTHVDPAFLPDLARVVCGDGYVTPPWRGLCSVGATYDTDADGRVREDSQRDNLARLAALFPGLAVPIDALPLAGRTGFRAVAPDRLPLVGAAPDHEALFASRAERLRDVPRQAGLFVLQGLASRGLTWAPLAAELLAAQMSGEPLPLERDLSATLDPARFALQRHRTGRN